MWPWRIHYLITAVVLGLLGALSVSSQSNHHPQTEPNEDLLVAFDTPLVADLTGHSHDHGAVSLEETSEAPSPKAGLIATSDETKPTLSLIRVGQLEVHYKNEVPDKVKARIEAAVATWDELIILPPSATLAVELHWKSIPITGVLGYAGPNRLYKNSLSSSPLPKDNALYPPGLVNSFTNSDYNGPDQAEILVHLNSDLCSASCESGSWYLGSSTPANYQYDLETVMLHELAHGLGFMGSGSENGLAPTPYIYDYFNRWQGRSLLSYADEAAALKSSELSIMTSNSLRTKLYAPEIWRPGSSQSHFDHTVKSLMTPSIRSGEMRRNIDSWTLSVLDQIGWKINAAPTPAKDLTVSTTATTASLNWKVPYQTQSLLPDRTILQVRADGKLIDSQSLHPKVRTHTFKGLKADSLYRFTVKTVTNGKPSALVQKSVRTKTAPIKKPASTSPRRNLALDGQILRAYIALLDIEPDNTSYQNWLNKLSRGTKLIALYQSLASDKRYGDRYGGLNNTDFVKRVYENLLNRPPSPAELRTHLERLKAGGQKLAVLMAVAESAEYAKATKTVVAYSSREGKIRRLYKAIFLRNPDSEGLKYWYGRSQAGLSLAKIASAMVYSQEFTNRYSSLSDSQFITRVYLNVLGRNPDTEGRNFWLWQLSIGQSRGKIMTGFSESAEYIKATGTIP